MAANPDKDRAPWTGNADWGLVLGAIVVGLAVVLWLMMSAPAR